MLLKYYQSLIWRIGSKFSKERETFGKQQKTKENIKKKERGFIQMFEKEFEGKVVLVTGGSTGIMQPLNHSLQPELKYTS